MEQKIVTPVQKGLVISLILILIGMAIYFSGQIGNKSLGYLQYLVFIGGIIWGCTYYAKQMNGNVTFGNVFAHGFKTTAFIAATMAVYTFISVKFLFPDIVDKSLDMVRIEMEKNKDVTDEQRQQALNMTKEFFVPFAVGGLLLMFAIFGAIASLIGAAVSKKKPQDPFAQPQM